MLPWYTALPLSIGWLAATALAWGQARPRRFLAWLLGLTCLILPWYTTPAPRIIRAVVALGSLLPILRLLDFARDRAPRTPWFRVWAMLMPFDVREATRTQRQFDWRSLGLGLTQVALVAFGVAIVQRANADGSPFATTYRLAGSLLGVYFLLEAGNTLALFSHRLFGWEFPPIQNTPIASRSVREFWSQRWNRTVSRWLRRSVFVPLVRRRAPHLASFAAFAISGAIHAWLVITVLSPSEILAMAGFFVAQGIVVAIEDTLPIKRWPRFAQHTWTLCGLLLPAPLFLVPMANTLR